MGDAVSEEDTISAGDLRAAGISIPAEIPDCAWVPRSSMQYRLEPLQADGDVLRMNAYVTFTQAFSWVEVPVLVEAKS